MNSTFAIIKGFGPVFLLLFMLQFISMGAMEMSGPFWPLRMEELSKSTGAFTLAGIGVYVCPMLGISLTSALWGRMGDRYGNRLMMVRALIGLAATQFLIAFAPNVWSILFLRFLQGACAGYIAPAQAYGIQITGGHHRGVLLTWLQVATNVGSLGGAFIGGLILDASSFETINLAAGVVCAICAFVSWLALPRPADPVVGLKKRGAPDVFQRQLVPVFGVLLLIGMLLASRMALQVPFALYMQDIFRAPHWLTGLSYGLLALGFVIAAPFWARFFSDRAAVFVLQWMIAIAAACAFLTFAAGVTHSTTFFATIYFCWGALLGGTTPILLSLVSAATPSDRQGSVLGMAQSCQQIASIAGIVAGAGINQFFGAQVIYPFVSLLYIVSLFVACGLWLAARAPKTLGDTL